MKTSAPATADAVALLTKALSEGHAVTLSLAAPPRVDHTSALVATCCLAFGLTQAEARVLVGLMEQGYAGKEDLLVAMSPHGKVPKINTLDVVVCRLRQKLAVHGVEIVTVYGQGFKLNESGRDKIQKMLTGFGEEDAGAGARAPP